MRGGFLLLYRKIIESRVFQNEGLFKVWIWCMCKASRTRRWVTITVGKGSTEVELAPGQFIFGRLSAAKELRMKPGTVQFRMQKLVSMQNLIIEPSSHYSIVTVVKFEGYQKRARRIHQPISQPSNSQSSAVQQPSITVKEGTEECIKEGTEEVRVCPEPAAPTSGPPPILVFPLHKTGTTWGLTEAKLAEYRESFPGLDVFAVCRKARQWCIDNPSKRKTAKGMPAFLSRWINKEVDRPAPRMSNEQFALPSLDIDNMDLG